MPGRPLSLKCGNGVVPPRRDATAVAFFTHRALGSGGVYYLAAALRAAGRPEDALEPLERASRLAPADPSVRFELAALHYDLGVKAFQKGGGQ
jgi:tetratricopeptide (TPR) repeat protein